MSVLHSGWWKICYHWRAINLLETAAISSYRLWVFATGKAMGIGGVFVIAHCHKNAVTSPPSKTIDTNPAGRTSSWSQLVDVLHG